MHPNSHYQNHNHHLCPQASINHSLCSTCCCCSCKSSSFSHLSPPSIPLDQLLQYMSSDLFKIQSFAKPQQIHSQTLDNTQSLLNALARRVSAVESSLSQLTSRSPPPPPKSPPPPSSFRQHATLRDVAARTIQLRFRRFLVRRSQTLRDLKRLASVKSNAALLRSSISSEGEPDALSQKAMDLLLQLDSIQSSDPMIRDGKRSISRELTAMLDFIEKVFVRERRLSRRVMEVQNDAAPQLPPVRSAKRVSFAEHGNKETKILEEEVFGYENSTFVQVQEDGFGLSAPLPVHMEPRLGF